MLHVKLSDWARRDSVFGGLGGGLNLITVHRSNIQ